MPDDFSKHSDPLAYIFSTSVKIKQTTWLPSAEQIASTLEQIGADGVGLQAHRDAVTKSFLNQLRNEGVTEFHVWTVDDPDDANFFIREGAFAITTNTPAQLRRHIQSH